MTDGVFLPTLCGTGSDVLIGVVDFIHQAVVKSVWTPERIRRVYARRTVRQILADGDTLAFGPCPDRTLVACAILHRHGIRPVVVYHERRVPGFGPSTAHLALEVEVGGADYTVDFGSHETRLVPGGYTYDPAIEETILLKRLEIPVGADALTTITPGEVMAAVATERIQVDRKFEYYEKQAERYRGRVPEERLALDVKHSIHREL
ncbi:hypothetical protein [Actinosynnema sp. NPDC023587]|uniref:hypothetical protein n=1 Tax=Actinosynnema sp. NPDC023587 TaxID=3154695 RepID=UPI0033F14B5A